MASEGLQPSRDRSGSIRSIQASTQSQERSCSSAAETVMALLGHAREGVARLPILSIATTELREQAEMMGRELERFGAADQDEDSSAA